MHVVFLSIEPSVVDSSGFALLKFSDPISKINESSSIQINKGDDCEVKWLDKKQIIT